MTKLNCFSSCRKYKSVTMEGGQVVSRACALNIRFQRRIYLKAIQDQWELSECSVALYLELGHISEIKVMPSISIPLFHMPSANSGVPWSSELLTNRLHFGRFLLPPQV